MVFDQYRRAYWRRLCQRPRLLEAPFNGLLLGAFLIIGAWHMRIGMMEIIADYIYPPLKGALLIINWLVVY